MSLAVPTEVLTAAERGELDDARFLAVVRESLPYAWQVVAAAADDQAARPGRPFSRRARRAAAVRAGPRAAAAGAGQHLDPQCAGAALRGRAGLPELPPGGRVRPGRGGLPGPPRVRQPARLKSSTSALSCAIC